MQNILKKLPKKARYNMIISDITASLVFLAIIQFLSIFVYSISGTPQVIQDNFSYLYYILVVWTLLDIILTQTVGYKRVKYSISDKSVEVYRGIYFISHEIVPIKRMQQVNINQGPINKLLKLSNIDVITSGGQVELKYIKEEEVDEIASLLRDKINEAVINEEKQEDHSMRLIDDAGEINE